MKQMAGRIEELRMQNKSMKQMNIEKTDRGQGWLLFFYSIPSKPVSNRMKIWRKLLKAGTVQLKGAVYILPDTEEHYELFQWLVSEVESMGGQAAFTKVRTVDSIKDEEIQGLFRERQEGEYRAIGKSLDDLETRVNSIKKGSETQDGKTLSDHLARVKKKYEDALKTDFFFSRAGAALRSRIDALNTVLRGLTGSVAKTKPALVSTRKIEDFQRRIWVSCKRPFVDRMASAWLIKRFIDKEGTFKLVDGGDLAGIGKGHITFDISGGVFTHIGDLCTFEVLVKSFALRDKAVRKIAEVVHELDIRDDKYRNSESKGLEDILSGLRKSVKDDMELLEKGISIFEMLYQSKARTQHE